MSTIIKLLLIIIPIASAITCIFKIKQEKSIFITYIGILLSMYLLGIFNILKVSLYIIYILSAISLIYTIYSLTKRKIKVKDIISPGTIIFIIAVNVLYFITSHTCFVEWDEFSHWGANLKAMVERDILWASNKWDGVHVVYPPLAGIAEYFMCKVNGAFQESIAYLGLDVFMLAIIMPIFSNIEYKVKDWIKAILTIISIYCIIFIFNFSLTSLYIDLLLGLLFFIGLHFGISWKDSKENRIILGLILATLILSKDVGIIFAGIILMQIFIKDIFLESIKNRAITKQVWKVVGYLLICVLIIGLSYCSWKIYCGINDRVLDDRHDKNGVSTFDIGTYIKAATGYKSEGKYKEIAKIFYNNLNEGDLISKYPFSTTLQIAVVFNIIGIILYLTTEKENKSKILTSWIALDIGLFIYIAFLLMIYLFAMTEVEGIGLASYSRYIGTYYIAWIIFIISCIINYLEKSKSFLGIGILFLVCIYGCNVYQLILPAQNNKESTILPEIRQQAEMINENVEENDKVYIISQNDQTLGLGFHQLRYCISPISTNLLFEWSLGDPYFEGDIWTLDLSKDEFEKKLIEENYQYVFFKQCDEQFINRYGDLFENINEETNNGLYKVINQNENVKLQKVKSNK